MKYLYLDESGQPDNKSDGDFYVTVIETETPKSLEKAVKKTIQHSKRGKNVGYLHGYLESPATINRLLRYLAKLDLSIYTVKIPISKLGNSPKTNYVNAVKSLFAHLEKTEEYRLISAKYFAKVVDDEKYIADIEREFSNITVRVVPSYASKCLQCADIASWVIWNKNERKYSGYYKIIAEKIKGEYRE